MFNYFFISLFSTPQFAKLSVAKFACKCSSIRPVQFYFGWNPIIKTTYKSFNSQCFWNKEIWLIEHRGSINHDSFRSGVPNLFVSASPLRPTASPLRPTASPHWYTSTQKITGLRPPKSPQGDASPRLGTPVIDYYNYYTINSEYTIIHQVHDVPLPIDLCHLGQIFLFVFLSFYLSVYLSFCPFVYLSICLYLSTLFHYLSFCLSV